MDIYWNVVRTSVANNLQKATNKIRDIVYSGFLSDSEIENLKPVVDVLGAILKDWEGRDEESWTQRCTCTTYSAFNAANNIPGSDSSWPDTDNSGEGGSGT